MVSRGMSLTRSQSSLSQHEIWSAAVSGHLRLVLSDSSCWCGAVDWLSPVVLVRLWVVSRWTCQSGTWSYGLVSWRSGAGSGARGRCREYIYLMLKVVVLNITIEGFIFILLSYFCAISLHYPRMTRYIDNRIIWPTWWGGAAPAIQSNNPVITTSSHPWYSEDL